MLVRVRPGTPLRVRATLDGGPPPEGIVVDAFVWDVAHGTLLSRASGRGTFDLCPVGNDEVEVVLCSRRGPGRSWLLGRWRGRETADEVAIDLVPCRWAYAVSEVAPEDATVRLHERAPPGTWWIARAATTDGRAAGPEREISAERETRVRPGIHVVRRAPPGGCCDSFEVVAREGACVELDDRRGPEAVRVVIDPDIAIPGAQVTFQAADGIVVAGHRPPAERAGVSSGSVIQTPRWTNWCATGVAFVRIEGGGLATPLVAGTPPGVVGTAGPSGVPAWLRAPRPALAGTLSVGPMADVPTWTIRLAPGLRAVPVTCRRADGQPVTGGLVIDLATRERQPLSSGGRAIVVRDASRPSGFVCLPADCEPLAVTDAELAAASDDGLDVEATPNSLPLHVRAAVPDEAGAGPFSLRAFVWDAATGALLVTAGGAGAFELGLLGRRSVEVSVSLRLPDGRAYAAAWTGVAGTEADVELRLRPSAWSYASSLDGCSVSAPVGRASEAWTVGPPGTEPRALEAPAAGVQRRVARVVPGTYVIRREDSGSRSAQEFRVDARDGVCVELNDGTQVDSE